MFGSKIIRSLLVVLLLSFVCSAASAEVFETLEVTPANPHPWAENANRYLVTYFKSLDGKTFQVFPTRAEKEKDLDLILAEVVRFHIRAEYLSKGLYLDENDVQKADPQEIVKLVAKDHISSAWGKGNVEKLQQYLQQHSNLLKLFKMVAYLDYQDEKGQFISGMDIDPILFKFGASPDQADEISIIRVMTENQ